MQENWKVKAAEIAYNNATNSMDSCAQFVRQAIQQARDQDNVGWGKSAKDCGPQLQQLEYVQTDDDGDYNDGDIIIWDQVRDHEHGHIQIYWQGKWVSDHIQNDKNPWRDREEDDTYTLYR